MGMDLITQLVSQGLSAVLPFIILLGLLIFVHELGHFLVAIACGVHVEVFSLGFGKKLLQYNRKGTIYCISMIPLGGYVKMYGDDVNADIPAEKKSQSFTHKSVYQRIAIVLAGPLMNFFFAILIFAIVATLGEDARAPKLGDIALGSKASTLGFQSGDTILAVDGQAVHSWDQVQAMMNKRIGLPLTFEVSQAQAASKRSVEAIPDSKQNPNILSLDSQIGELEGLSLNSIAPVIGVRSGSAAEAAGLKTGDRIVAMNDQPIAHYRELTAAWSAASFPLKLKLERSSSESMDPATIKDPRKKAPTEKPSELELSIPNQIAFEAAGIDSSELYLFSIVKGSPAEKAGLASGDKILSISEVAITSWEKVVSQIKSFNGRDPVALVVQRGTETKNFSIVPEMTSHTTLFGGEEKRFTIGIVPWVTMANLELVKIQVSNPLKAAQRGFQKTVDASVMTLVSFVRLIQGMISPKHIGGVISIGQAAHETYKMGLTSFLQMMAVISVHLFVLNLLPVPVLDGGHLLFYSIELLRGTPLSMRKLEIAQQVGLVLLMSLMAFALFNDFSRVLGLW